MTSTVPSLAEPSGGFEAPLEMLSACHHRALQQCATLQRLAAQMANNGANDDLRIVATAVTRFFDASVKQHHADEETDLYPALIESMAGSDAVCIRELVESLTRDHRALESHWQRLRLDLARIAAGDLLPVLSADVAPFIRLYEQHIAREENELLPMAARLLGDDALRLIGNAMRERHGSSAID